MARLLAASFVLLAGAAALGAQPPTDLVVTQNELEFHSAFWPNLHSVLWAEAWAQRPLKAGEPPMAGSLPERLPASVSGEERKAWDDAVAYYDREIADLHPLFDATSTSIRTAMINPIADFPVALDEAYRAVLRAAAPIYRQHLWPIHDRANREWITAAVAKLQTISPAVPERLSKLYDAPWFTRPLRVDVVRVSSREGAFTSLNPLPGHITLSTSSPAGQDWAAVEIILHEASHLLFLPMVKLFGAELQAQGKNTRIGPVEAWNANLWHPALFYSTGEVVRQALESRGIAYVPYLYANGMLERSWPHFRAPIETHWKPFVDGKLTRDEAIKRLVADLR
jgi:hypothetical protein